MRVPRLQNDIALRQLPESVRGPVRAVQEPWHARLATRRQILVGAAAGTMAVTAAALPLRYRGRIFEGTIVGPVDVSGMTAAEARDALRGHLGAVTSQPISLRIADRIWTSTLDELGFSVDLDATVEHALARGRDDGVAGQYVHSFGLGDGENVSIVFWLNDAVLEQKLAAIAHEAGTPSRPASLRLDAGELVLDEGAAGIHVDPATAREAVLEAIARQPIGMIEVPVGFLEPATSAADLEPAFIHAQTLTATPVTIDVDGQAWDILPDALLTALVLPSDPVHEQPRLDPEKLRDALPESLAKGVVREPQNARLGFAGGKVTIIAEALPGRTFDPAATAKAIAEAATSRERRSVGAAFDETPAAVCADTIAELGLVTRMAVGTSSFAGSPDERRTNVFAAAGHITDSLVAPGETWSFLDTLGPISVETGFAEGRGFGANWFESGIGGGACQISTTVFRAALFAGLPIHEWYSHAYRIDYYEQDGSPVGLDCAIYQPDTEDEWPYDLKIGNPTSNWIYIQLTVEGDIATAELFGGALDHEAEVLPPYVSEPVPPPEPEVQVDDSLNPGEEKMIEPAHPGYDVSTTRVLVQDGVAIDEQVFATTYFAQPELWLVGPEPEY
ncbi:MAG: VanW family protein [Thermomicrobiales bacterium]